VKPLSESKEAQLELCELIYDTYNACKSYGRQPETLKSYTKIFKITLEDYNILQIRDAFKHYWKTQSDFPAPADIVKIIESNKPKINRECGMKQIEELLGWKQLI